MLNVKVQSENRSFQEMELQVIGELDSVSSWDFYDFLNEQENKGYKKFILNLSELESISSGGISVLFRLKKKFLESNSAMVFIHLNPEIDQLFNFFGFHRTFLLSNDKESAEKLLESIYFLKNKSETYHQHQPAAGNRFTIIEENPPAPKEFAPLKEKVVVQEFEKVEQIPQSQKSEESEIIHFGDFDPERLETQIDEIVKEYETIPKLEDIPYIEEIATEPFLSTDEVPPGSVTQEAEKIDTEFSIPFVTKSYGYEKDEEIVNSILLSTSPGETEEFNQLVINCGKCGLKLRVNEQGVHKCPSCNSRFHIRQSGSISTIENL